MFPERQARVTQSLLPIDGRRQPHIINVPHNGFLFRIVVQMDVSNRQRDNSSIQSIERAAAVMRCFTEHEPELTLTELSRRVQLPKSTVARILAALQREGFVGKSENTGRYRLGVGLISLAGVALGRLDVRGAAYNFLEELVQRTQESASVSVPDGAEAVIILHMPSPKPVRYVNWIGRRLPLHCTASGKVLLSGMNDERRARVSARPLRRYTGRTIVERAALEVELERVRAEGIALAHEEHEQGYSAIAAPIRNLDGDVVGAISISGPSFRLPVETLLGFSEALKDTAMKVSAEMGYREGVA